MPRPRTPRLVLSAGPTAGDDVGSCRTSHVPPAILGARSPRRMRAAGCAGSPSPARARSSIPAAINCAHRSVSSYPYAIASSNETASNAARGITLQFKLMFASGSPGRTGRPKWPRNRRVGRRLPAGTLLQDVTGEHDVGPLGHQRLDDPDETEVDEPRRRPTATRGFPSPAGVPRCDWHTAHAEVHERTGRTHMACRHLARRRPRLTPRCRRTRRLRTGIGHPPRLRPDTCTTPLTGRSCRCRSTANGRQFARPITFLIAPRHLIRRELRHRPGVRPFSHPCTQGRILAKRPEPIRQGVDVVRFDQEPVHPVLNDEWDSAHTLPIRGIRCMAAST